MEECAGTACRECLYRMRCTCNCLSHTVPPEAAKSGAQNRASAAACSAQGHWRGGKESPTTLLFFAVASWLFARRKWLLH